MKKLQNTLALALLAVAGTASAQDIRASVDNNPVSFPDVKPVMIKGRVMVPIRGVFEHMNATVQWDSKTRLVTATQVGNSVQIPINALYAKINDRQVQMDAPAIIYGRRTMVPLRFLSEALGASVDWVASTRTVEISTGDGVGTPPPAGTGGTAMRLETGAVIPMRLNQKLSSNMSKEGDTFRAALDTSDANYGGLPSGTLVEGRVRVARAKSGETPGLLGLGFDRVKLPDGRTYPISGTLIGLDSESVTEQNGRLVAKPAAKKDSLTWVGYGAGAGALISLLTKGNVLTNALIGGALGYILGEVQKDPSKARDVTLDPGTTFGVRLTRDLSFKPASQARR